MANMQIARDEDPNVAEKVTQVIGSHSIYYRVSQKKLSLVENSRGKYNSCGWEIQWDFLINPDCCVAF